MPTEKMQEELTSLGLLAGWGSTVGRCRSTVNLMLELLQACWPGCMCRLLLGA